MHLYFCKSEKIDLQEKSRSSSQKLWGWCSMERVGQFLRGNTGFLPAIRSSWWVKERVFGGYERKSVCVLRTVGWVSFLYGKKIIKRDYANIICLICTSLKPLNRHNHIHQANLFCFLLHIYNTILDMMPNFKSFILPFKV